MPVDLSHRVRTPLTSLRMEADALADPVAADRIGAGVDAVNRAVTEVIQQARRRGAPLVSIEVCADTGETAPADVGGSNGAFLAPATIQLELNDASPEDIFQRIVAQLPLERLRSLTLDELPLGAYGGRPYMPPEATWRELFARALDVRTLTVVGHVAEHLPAALHLGEGDDAVGLFPKLQHLTLDRVPVLTVSLVDSMEEDGDSFWVRGKWYESFVAALRTRADLGNRLERLSISGTDAITDCEVDELRRYVTYVVWDRRSA